MKNSTIAIEELVAMAIDTCVYALQETLKECESRCCDSKSDRNAIVKQFRENAQEAFDHILSDLDETLKERVADHSQFGVGA